ncbi:hypothetical protein ABF87_13020 [Nitrosomonas sp. JL21]|nr:hypothetical protein [Nitrosomonas sp. JL21]
MGCSQGKINWLEFIIRKIIREIYNNHILIIFPLSFLDGLNYGKYQVDGLFIHSQIKHIIWLNRVTKLQKWRELFHSHIPFQSI